MSHRLHRTTNVVLCPKRISIIHHWCRHIYPLAFRELHFKWQWIYSNLRALSSAPGHKTNSYWRELIIQRGESLLNKCWLTTRGRNLSSAPHIQHLRLTHCGLITESPGKTGSSRLESADSTCVCMCVCVFRSVCREGGGGSLWLLRPLEPKTSIWARALRSLLQMKAIAGTVSLCYLQP